MDQMSRSGGPGGEVTLSGRLICADAAQAGIVRDHLADHIRLTMAEPGCISFAVEATSDPLVWQVDERFVGADAFAAHQERVRASAWGVATAGIRREYRISGLEQG